MEERIFNAITPKSISEYCNQHTSHSNEVLKNLYKKSEETGQLKMASGEYLGRFLSTISRSLSPTRILEIGTFTGYGTICLCEGLNDEGKIYTIEKNSDLENFSQDSFRQLNMQDKVIQLIGDAKEIIPEIDEVWDLVFIDAAKRQYIDYYELVLPKLRKGGVILADNTLWKGTVVDATTDKLGEGIKNFNSHVFNDERVSNILLPIDDGVHYIIKN